MPSPPKPWERAGVVPNSASVGSPSPIPAPTAPASSVASSATAVDNTASSSSGAPPVPARPASLTSQQPSASTSTSLVPTATTGPYTSPFNRFGTAGYSPYGATSAYGSSIYGGGYGGYGGAYGSSLYGSSLYGNSLYGGSMYGGMGMGYGATGYMGMGMPGTGMPGDPSQSLTAQLSNTTQHTFALLHSIVQTFGGFAQMLDSTFLATHSSFFAIVGVIDQFAALRDVVGHVLGVFGLIRWAKGVLSGEGVVPRSALTDEFNHFVNNGGPTPGASAGGPKAPGAPAGKPSKKPIIVFLLAIFGIPYLMHKLIQRLSNRPPVQLLPSIDPVTGQPTLTPQPLQMTSAETPLDPSKLTFVHALYPFETGAAQELPLRKGDIVAVLSRTDPITGAEGEWWRGKTRDGREGWFPRGFVEVIRKKGEEPEPPKVVKTA